MQSGQLDQARHRQRPDPASPTRPTGRRATSRRSTAATPLPALHHQRRRPRPPWGWRPRRRLDRRQRHPGVTRAVTAVTAPWCRPPAAASSARAPPSWSTRPAPATPWAQGRRASALTALGYPGEKPTPVPAAWLELFADGPAPDGPGGGPARRRASRDRAAARDGRARARRVAVALPLLAPVRVAGAEGPQCELGEDAVRQRRRPTPSPASASRSPGRWRPAGASAVAVVDSGVDPGNAHLARRLVPGTSFVPGPPHRGHPRPRHRVSPASSPRGTVAGVRAHRARRRRRRSCRCGCSRTRTPTGSRPVAVPAGHRADGPGHRVGGPARRRRHQRVDEHPSDRRRRCRQLKAALALAAAQGRRGRRLGRQPGRGRALHPGALPRRRRRRDRGRRHQHRPARSTTGRSTGRRTTSPRPGIGRADRLPRQRRLPRRPGARVHQLGGGVRQRARRPAAGALPEGVGGADRLPDHGLGRPARGLRAGRRAGLGRDPALHRADDEPRPEPGRARRCPAPKRGAAAATSAVAGHAAGRRRRPARAGARAGAVVGPRRGRASAPWRWCCGPGWAGQAGRRTPRGRRRSTPDVV